MIDEISEVQVIPVKPNNGLVGFASFVLNDSWYLGSIGIFTRLKGGYRLVYPAKNGSKKPLQVYHPISRSVGYKIEKVIVKKFEEVTKNNARYSSNSDE